MDKSVEDTNEISRSQTESLDKEGNAPVCDKSKGNLKRPHAEHVRHMDVAEPSSKRSNIDGEMRKIPEKGRVKNSGLLSPKGVIASNETFSSETNSSKVTTSSVAEEQDSSVCVSTNTTASQGKPQTVIASTCSEASNSRKNNSVKGLDKLSGEQRSRGNTTARENALDDSDVAGQSADSEHDDATSTEWTLKEKKSLVEGLKRKYIGNVKWHKLQSRVKSKPVAEIKRYTEKLIAESNDGSPVFFVENYRTSLEVMGILLGVPRHIPTWMGLMEHMRGSHDDIDAKCLPQLLTIAAVEPTSQTSGEGFLTPNYCRIYSYLGCILRGETPGDLSAVDAKVILELLHGLKARLAHSDYDQQVKFIRNTNSVITVDILRKQWRGAAELLEKQIKEEEQEMTDQDRAANLKPKLKKWYQGEVRRSTRPKPSEVKPVSNKPKLSSLNPINVPVGILNVKLRQINTR